MIKKLFLSVVFFCFTLWVQAKDYADYVSPLVELSPLSNFPPAILILRLPVRGE